MFPSEDPAQYQYLESSILYWPLDGVQSPPPARRDAYTAPFPYPPPAVFLPDGPSDNGVLDHDHILCLPTPPAPPQPPLQLPLQPKHYPSNSVAWATDQPQAGLHGTSEMNNVGGTERAIGVRCRKRALRKDRHSKIETAQGLRDRRMRLSLDVARRFFDLQDRLGFDKASRTVEWLLNESKNAIKDLSRCAPSPPAPQTDDGDGKHESPTSSDGEALSVSIHDDSTVGLPPEEEGAQNKSAAATLLSKNAAAAPNAASAKETRLMARERTIGKWYRRLYNGGHEMHDSFHAYTLPAIAGSGSGMISIFDYTDGAVGFVGADAAGGYAQARKLDC